MRLLSSLLIFISVWLCFSPVTGQIIRQDIHGKSDEFGDDPRVFGKNNISFSLLPLFQSGFELSYERKFLNKNRIKITPIYYRLQDYKSSTGTDLKLVNGLGFKLHHKYFPYHSISSKLGLFLEYGPGFQHFDLTTKGQQVAKFDKYGLECIIGFHKIFADVFYFEFYGGLASYYFQNKSDKRMDWQDVLKDHNQVWFDYGTTGNYFLFGINFGILF